MYIPPPTEFGGWFHLQTIFRSAHMRIRFTRIAANKLRFSAYTVNADGTEKPVTGYDFNPYQEKALYKLADRLSVKIDALYALTQTAMGGDNVDEQITNPTQYSIQMRGQLELVHNDLPRFDGTNPIEVLRTAFNTLGYPKPNPVLKWGDKELMCVVDIDYHNWPMEQRPQFDQLRHIASQIIPAPLVYHPSHGRGAKLYYVAYNNFTAEELAAAGALAWLDKDGRATAELKTETRHPRYNRVDRDTFAENIPESEIIYRHTLDCDIPAIAHHFKFEVSQDAIDNYLEERGMKVGERYPHDMCPIDPSSDSERDPVRVFPDAIYCHKCAGKERAYGKKRTPGMAPFTMLVGGKQAELNRLAKHYVHWTHADYVLRYHYTIPKHLLQLAYKCAMKIASTSPCDPRIEAAFKTDAIIRTHGQWKFANDSEGTTVSPKSTRIYSKLPTTWIVKQSTVDGTYKITSDGGKVEAIAHAGRSLVEFGYDDLKSVNGMQMWGHRLAYASGIIPVPSTFGHLPNELHPKYIPVKARNMEWAKGKVEEVFPGVDWNYIQLLVAMRGLVESGQRNVFILTIGPSSTGKSSTVAIVCGLLGDRWNEIVYNGNEERLRQGVQESITQGNYTVIDEVFKKADAARISPRAALDPILTLTPHSKSHKLYTGSVGLGGHTVMVMTDIELPIEVAADAQLSRRIVEVQLTKEISWDATIASNGITGPAEFRRVSPEHNLAADMLCSYWIDTLFDRPKSLDELLEHTPYTYLKHTTEFGDVKEPLRMFYELLCKAPPLDEKDASKIAQPEGFKKIASTSTDDLRDSWDGLADGASGMKWLKSRRIKEIDWTRNLNRWYKRNIPGAVKVDFRNLKESAILVRFRLDNTDGTFYNEDILKRYIANGEDNTQSEKQEDADIS